MWLRSRYTVIPFIFFIAGFVHSGKVYSQGLGNSPYSVLGIGEVYSEAFAGNQSSGEAGVAYSNGLHVNNLNPALWVKGRATMFEFGTIFQYKKINDLSSSQRDLGGNLAYLGLSLPVGRKWTAGVSLKPHSFVDYESRFASKIPGTNYNAFYSSNGKGAINQASFVNSFQIGKYLSAGLEVSYLFGNVTKSTTAQTVFGDGNDFLVSKNNKINYSDVLLRGGAAVSIPIKKENKLNLNFGGTYTLGNDINSTQTTTFELTKNSFVVGNPDTLIADRNRSFYLPHNFRIGTTLTAPYHWTIAVDYQHQAWGEYKNKQETSSSSMADVGRIHVGAEYIPRFSSTRYFDLVTYKVGFNHGKMPYSISGVELKETNISLGFSLPIGRSANSLHLTFIGGQRGVPSRNSVKEQYGRVVLGFTLADRWFEKMRID